MEQLEEAARLANIDSPLKYRRVLILLDNLAEILTHRFCRDRYRNDFAHVQAVSPRIGAKLLAEGLGSYRTG